MPLSSAPLNKRRRKKKHNRKRIHRKIEFGVIRVQSVWKWLRQRKRPQERDVTLSAVRLQLKNVNTKQTTHRKKAHIRDRCLTDRHTFYNIFWFWSCLFLKRKKIVESRPWHMRSKETTKEFCLVFARGCNWIKTLLHSVSFHARAVKTYARSFQYIVDRASCTQQKLFIHPKWVEWTKKKRQSGLAVLGYKRVYVCREGSSGRQPLF